MNRWRVVSLGCWTAGLALAAEWMRAPGWLFAAALAWLALVAAVATWRGGRAPLAAHAALAALALLAVTAALETRTIHRLAGDWSAVREAAITNASNTLGAELDAAVALARRLAANAAAAAGLPPDDAFTIADETVGRSGPLHGVTVFDRAGRPLAWAGAQRLTVGPAGPDLEAVTTPFYLWLVARRQTSGGAAVAAVLLARAGEVPAAGAALADRFVARTGVGLRFLDHRAAPPDSDVFDYVLPLGTAGAGDTLFAVRPVPPTQGAMQEEALASARRVMAWILAVLLGAAVTAAVREPWPLVLRAAPLAAGLVVVARAPLERAFGGVFFDESYYAPILRFFSTSAGTLALFGLLAAAGACAIWRIGPRPRPAFRIVAVLGSLAAPYLLQDLARGITPPAAGTTVGLWLVWQGALTLSAAATVLLAAALIRGAEPPRHGGKWPFVAGGIAVAAAIFGLWLWQPLGAWPEWYPYLWVPALLLAIRPMPFRSALATIAVVAGSAAALLTWGAAAEGRMRLAQRDLEGLGGSADPLAVALLDRLVQELPATAPAGAGDLYLAWRTSALGGQGYPGALAVWTPALTRETSLDLAVLDIPDDTIRAAAREAQAAGVPSVRPLLRAPGLHGLAAVPLAGGRVLTVAVGPRSRLVPPTRLARLLAGGGAEPDPPYEIAMAPAAREGTTGTVRWERSGWIVRGERALDLPAGQRHAHAIVDLRGPGPLLQRGALVLVFDIGLLLGLWILVESVAGRLAPAWRSWVPRARRSLRWRLTVSLAVFFLAPTVIFATWSYGRLESEFRGARTLLLQRTLRDAAAVLADTVGPGAPAALRDAAHRFDAPLALARDGRMIVTSAPVLLDFGLLDRFVAGPAYRRLAWGDDVEASADQASSSVPTLVGYRLLARDGRGTLILAVPEFLSDPALRRREADLGIAVLVATAAGCLAALILSAIGARALARPMQQLRGAALEVGAGRTPALDPADVPTELEPVAGALRQAGADVERGQRAQRVLAWGEMARQVAHEIKNPLTPIRLGIQHILRVHREKPAELGTVLTGTGERILAEIDRLDSIARTFSRFALPGEGVPVERVDTAAVVDDVVRLYRLGETPVTWEAVTAPALLAFARRDELVEVLVNLCENARDAGARRVVVEARTAEAGARIEVRDDGRGIAADILPRVFEPRFSTTTSGSGLGLAIAKRLVESWGGTIGIGSRDGGGTVVSITLRGVA